MLERDEKAGLVRVVRERSTELVILFLAALTLYLASICVPLSSPEAAYRIAKEASQTVPSKDWDSFRREVIEELETRDRRADIRELLLHLSIALIVAIVILVAFDIRSESEARKRTSAFMDQMQASLIEFFAELARKQDEIAKNLYSGVFKRYLPESLTNEIENLILSKFVRERCSYTIIFSADHADKLAASNRFVLKRELRFQVRNFTLERASFPVVSGFTNAELEVVDGKPFPGHRGLWVGNEDRTAEIAGPHGVSIEVEGKECSKEITLFSEELMPMEGENPYTSASPTAGLTVWVRNELPSKIELARIYLLHSKENFQEVGPSEYHYTRGILPGQGCMIAWRRKP
jgi:hypothetical protein